MVKPATGGRRKIQIDGGKGLRERERERKKERETYFVW
jgi:hypothetical protein